LCSGFFQAPKLEKKRIKKSKRKGCGKMKSKVLVMFSLTLGLLLFGDLASSQDDNVGQQLDSPLALQHQDGNVKP
jgi:hypothetical protein